MSPKQLIEWALASDYNAIMVTDHNTWAGAQATMALAEESYADRLVVIPGLEFSCCRIHMNILNVSDIEGFKAALTGCEVPGACGWPSDADLQGIIRKTHSFGGKIVMNHWPWSHKLEGGERPAATTLSDHPSLAQLQAWGVDGFEIVNGSEFDFSTLRKLANIPNCTLLTGSDIHIPFSAYSWTLVKSASLTRAAIMNVLFSPTVSTDDTVAFQYHPQGTRYPNAAATFTANFWRIWIEFGSFVKHQLFMHVNQGMYSFSRSPSFCHAPIVNIYYSNVLWFLYVILFWLVASFLTFYYFFLRNYLVVAA